MKSNKKNNFFNRKTIFLFVAILLVVFVVGFVIFSNILKSKNTVKVAFYEVDDRTKEAIQIEFEKLATKEFSKNQKIEYVTLNSELSLAKNLEQTKNVYVLFCYNGESQKSVSKNALLIDNSTISAMPKTIQEVKNVGVPILINNIELCMVNNVLNDLDDDVYELNKVLAKMEESKTNGEFSISVAIPAKDDRSLALFLSAALESRYGIKELNKVYDYIAQNEEKNISVFDMLESEEFACFTAIVDELKQWKAKGILHSDWQNMSFDDVENFMATKSVGTVFMPLDLHRLLEYKVVSKYTDSFFPLSRFSSGVDSNYCFVMPVLLATCFDGTKKENAQVCKKIVSSMISLEEQEALSVASGLAPVASEAFAADKQATNVRFWAAASSKIAVSFDSAFTNPAARKKFFIDLRSFL